MYWWRYDPSGTRATSQRHEAEIALRLDRLSRRDTRRWPWCTTTGGITEER